MYKILIIEDDALTFRLAKTHLSKAGYEVMHAENGRVGIQVFESYRPDLIFCDIMMPELDGYEVLQWIRKHPTGNLVPFVFLSAKNNRDDIRHGMNLGADDYLMKPFSPEEMFETVRVRLERRHALAPHTPEPSNETPLGLPGRLSFQSTLHGMIKGWRPGSYIGIIRLELDHFETVRNALGYECGHHVLKLQAGKILEAAEIAGTLYHWGQGEFVILLPNLRSPQDLTALTSHLLQKTRSTIAWKTYELYITASIGTSIFPTDSTDPDELYRYSELAMHSAIDEGRNLARPYQPSLKEGAVDRLLLEHSMRHALENGLFQLYYQPQMEIATGRIYGAEALIRWIDLKAKKIVFPIHFIPLAEKNGMIVPLTEWVLNTGCAQAQLWNKAMSQDLKISLNLSSLQFKDKDFFETFSEILYSAKVRPESITLELTESFLMIKTEPILQILRKIKGLGVSISIDDFGTGYSSLGYLKDFPIDAIKIDQCFVRDITQSNDAQALTQAIITMAHNLGIQVVAEGVETAEQLSILREQGCDIIQGYWLSKAIPPHAFEEFYQTWKADSEGR